MKDSTSSLEFGTFERNALSERIAMRLLQLIREQKLRPGDRLPPERELAVMMQVSRPSLREALRALSIMNVIEHRQGSGTYVTSLEPERLVENLSFIISLDLPTFIEVLEARKVIEVGLAAMAARNISDPQIEELENCLHHSEEMIDDPESFVRADMAIHNCIAQASGNSILTTFMNSIYHVSEYSRRRTVEIEGVPQSTIDSHRKLVKAIQSRDPEAAAHAMREHLDYVEKRLQETGLDRQEVRPNE